MAKRRKKKVRAHHRRRKATARKSRARHFFGGGQHRPRMTVTGSTFHMRPKSPYKSKMRRVNRRHNPMLAEYLLGNPRHRRSGRRRHNPLGMSSLTNPVPLLLQGASGVGGILTPIVIGNLLTGYIAPMVPMISQPGIVGSAIKAGIRLGVVMAIDPFVKKIPGIDDNAFRIGEAVGIAGSFLMELLGRPLLLGPGDTGMTTAYLFGSFAPAAPAAAGTGAYFRRGGAHGTGAYFRRNLTGTGDAGALVPMARMRGTNGVGSLSPVPKDLFSAF